MVVVCIEGKDDLLKVRDGFRPEFEGDKLARFAHRLFSAQFIKLQTKFRIGNRWFSHITSPWSCVTPSRVRARLPLLASNHILLVSRVPSPPRQIFPFSCASACRLL